jgi:hypothetical protein
MVLLFLRRTQNRVSYVAPTTEAENDVGAVLHILTSLSGVALTIELWEAHLVLENALMLCPFSIRGNFSEVPVTQRMATVLTVLSVSSPLSSPDLVAMKQTKWLPLCSQPQSEIAG